MNVYHFDAHYHHNINLLQQYEQIVNILLTFLARLAQFGVVWCRLLKNVSIHIKIPYNNVTEFYGNKNNKFEGLKTAKMTGWDR